MTLPPDMDNIEFTEDCEDEFHALMSADGFVLTLSHHEILYLDDCLTLMIEREYENPLETGTHMSTMRNILPTAPLAVPIELIEKIGMGVLYVTDEENEGRNVEISFDASELYMLREITQSYIKVGDEPVGYTIKRKLYKALYSKKYEKAKTINRMIVDYNTTASPEKRIHAIINPQESP